MIKSKETALVMSNHKLTPGQSTRSWLKRTLLVLIIGLAVYISERFEIVVTRSGSRQQDSTAARLENNLLFQKDKKCVQLVTLSKDQLKAEAGYVEFLSTNEIPSSCLLGSWVRPAMIFDKILGLVCAL